MLKIIKEGRYPANVKYNIYIVEGDYKTVYGLHNNLGDAVYNCAKGTFPDLDDVTLQDLVRFYELLERTGFYLQNDFKSTDFRSPDPKNVYRTAMELKQRLLDHFRGNLKYPPQDMKKLEDFIENIQELTIYIKK